MAVHAAFTVLTRARERGTLSPAANQPATSIKRQLKKIKHPIPPAEREYIPGFRDAPTPLTVSEYLFCWDKGCIVAFVIVPSGMTGTCMR